MTADMSLTMDTLRLAMNLEQTRARVAAHNIAMSNSPTSSVMRLDMAQAQASLRAAHESPSLFHALVDSQHLDGTSFLHTQTSSNPVALDDEVAEISAASGRYQRLADGVSRQFALMQLAIKGGR